MNEKIVITYQNRVMDSYTLDHGVFTSLWFPGFFGLYVHVKVAYCILLKLKCKVYPPSFTIIYFSS